MVTVTMVLFLMPTEPDLPEGYDSYGALFIPWMTGYLHNHIGYFHVNTVTSYWNNSPLWVYIRGRGNYPSLLSCPYGNGNFIPESKIYDKGQYQ